MSKGIKPHQEHLYTTLSDGTRELKSMYKKFEKEINQYREHDTDSEDCWCCPTIEEHEGGNLIIHNRPN